MRFPTIPQDEQTGLVRLATLTNDQIDQLRTALAAAPVLLNREEFLKAIPPVEGIVFDDQEKIVWALTYLNSYLVTGSADITQFVADVRESLGAGVTGDVAEKVAAVLPGFLEIDSLRLRAKAVDLQVDHARGFQGARIVTDIRPVFSPSATTEVKGALIFHTLKIEYFQDADTREFFIALDERDLVNLQEALSRAQEKARTLRGLLVDKLEIKDFGSDPD